MAMAKTTLHDDFIMDAVYDYYGRRFATCSCDQKIRIWDIDEQTGDWPPSLTKPIAEFTAHKSSIWSLSWAYPEFGQIIASSSSDKMVRIWEEHGGVFQENQNNTNKWIMKAQLTESRKPVYDVEFAPRHLGLKLATCSGDGFVRIYEAVDVMNTSYWPLQDSFQADDISDHGCACLSWNKSRFEKPMLVVSGYSQEVKIWGYNASQRRWMVECELERHLDAVHDVSWAPNMGRSYHLIASAGKDNILKIHRLKRTPKGGLVVEHTQNLESDLKPGLPKVQIWRVEWNVTGTLLCSSGEDGIVRIWKANFNGEWKQVRDIKGEYSAVGNDPVFGGEMN